MNIFRKLLIEALERNDGYGGNYRHDSYPIAFNVKVHGNRTLANGATIGSDAVIGQCALIEQDAVIGQCALIEQDAVIGVGASIGQGATIGQGARIERHARWIACVGFADGYYKDLCVVGDVAYIGAGCHWFTLSEALRHWGNHPEERQDTLDLMQAAVAIAKRRGLKLEEA